MNQLTMKQPEEHPMTQMEEFGCVVIGGGPSGATAAHEMARRGHRVLLLDRAGRIKPCGGAIPPRLIRDFEIPDDLLVARARAARMIAPSNTVVDMPVGENGYVGMVDRDVFDEYLRNRAALAGCERRTGTFERITRDTDGTAIVHYFAGPDRDRTTPAQIRAHCIIGADGARSGVARAEVKDAEKMKYVFAYHEIIEAPEPSETFDPSRCDVFYQGSMSPDFYSWIFPHGKTVSVGTGTLNKGWSLRGAVGTLRQATGLAEARTIRREGAPIPLKPLKRWDNGRDVVLAGDAAGVVAPASGEGIYYAMEGGRLAALAADKFRLTGQVKALGEARKAFMKDHGRVFWILGIMQYFWYSNDKRRERFVSMCKDKDVQQLTWDSYMNKKLTRRKPAAHFKIFLKDTAHLFGFART